MNTTTFIGEQLLPGQIGYFLSILSFVAALVATFAFAKAFYANHIEAEIQWNKLAKTAFVIESVTIVSCFMVLFYLIYNHRFEYKYAYSH
ncbi:MAG: cytochrome c biogenesis protein CcsA, partial [Sediminibacterium sp.]